MKKLFLLLLLLLVAVSAAQAANTREFYFSAAVLQSLYQFEQAAAVMGEVGDQADMSAYSAKLLKALDSYRQAKEIIGKWTSDSNQKIREVALAIYDGIDVYIQNGNRLADVMKRFSGGEISESNLEGEIYAVYGEGGEEREDKASVLIGTAAASYLPEIFAEYASLNDPKGKIAYKITRKERKDLLIRIFVLFDKELTAYKSDPKNASDIIKAVSVLDQFLGSNTYEQVKQINNPFPAATLSAAPQAVETTTTLGK